MKKLVALLLAAIMVMVAMVGCESAAPAAEAPAAEAPAAEAPAAEAPAAEAPAAEKVFRTYITKDVPTLNSHDSVEGGLQTPYDYCSAPLYRKIPGEDGKSYTFLADCAAEWPIQIDETTWQIKIDPAAHWMNGEPINADTFMYSFRMNLDPIMANQMSDYLAQLSIKILNAKDYSMQGTAGTLTWEDVGIKKIDDYTIEIKTDGEFTQAQVMTHFTDRSTFPMYEPWYEAGMNETRTETNYGIDKDHFMSCGPYILDTWDMESLHVYVKNPDYWHADLFKYDRVEVRIIPTINARVELWEKGELDYLALDSTILETYIDDPRVSQAYNIYVDHIDINDKNTDTPILGQLAFRKAIYHAIDRVTLAKLAGYYLPAGFYVNMLAGMEGDDSHTPYRETPQGKSVTDLIESWGPNGYNEELAKQYFDEAYAAAGCEGVVKIRIMYEDNYTNFAKCTEYLQQDLPRIFGADKIEIEAVPVSGGSTAYKKLVGLNGWDLSWNDWGSRTCYTDPSSVFRFFVSSYASRPNSYTDEEFDAQYDVCRSNEVLADYQRHLDELAKLETIYLDKVIQVPIFQEVSFDMFADRIELPLTVYIPGFGWGDKFADIAE